MKISNIAKRIKKYLKDEDRKDVEFRALLALTELGDIVKYITHDKKLNPNARPYGTKSDETLAYGQAFVQTMATMILRGVDIEEALLAGLKNWEEKDWRKKCDEKNKKNKIISGIPAFPGNATGRAYILSRKHPIEKMPGNSILVAEMVNPGIFAYLAKAAGIITDQGGRTCHAALMSREQRIPCLVGTGNATQTIPHGSNVKIIIKENSGSVKLI